MSKQTVLKDIDFKLTETELAERAKEAARVNTEIFAVQAEKADVTKEFKRKLEVLENMRNKLLDQVDNGIECRAVECEFVKNYDAKKVEYYYRGELVESRDMTAEESQRDMAEVTRTAQPLRTVESDVPSQDAFARDIAQTHREETGRNTAYSALNGARN